jgi:hypothetical protein
MDPENVFDVVDYWNLRAAGTAPVALTLADYKDFEPLVREFGAAAAYPINEHVTNHVTLIKGRSITEGEVKVVADWIRSLDFLKDFSTMGWVPRFNMNYYGVGNEIDVRSIKAFESSPISVLTDGYGSLEGPSLPFLQDDPWVGRWSTDLSFYAYGQNDSCYRLPWLNAGCDALIQRKIGMGFELDAARISKQGIVAQHKGKRSSTTLQPITAVDVTKAFLHKAIRSIMWVQVRPAWQWNGSLRCLAAFGAATSSRTRPFAICLKNSHPAAPSQRRTSARQ